MTVVKICGITRLEDAQLAAELGASLLGFVLWPNSLRAASLETVRRVVPVLPDHVTPVGVFVNPTVDQVNAAATSGIRLAQVHGDWPVPLESVRVPVIRAVHLSGDGVEPAVDDELILLDAHDPVKQGGTGTTIDWARASRIAKTRRVILAGGLTPENVAAAIQEVRPFAVDVASGVEASPGVKDHARLRKFIGAALQAP
jgi:phosphoribosylanthranilate isomerase